ncbi:MAG: thermonuclease family protein [Desulfoplanes sp.]|nr:thermonuclease family protein [Desulfoplanes sp.]
MCSRIWSIVFLVSLLMYSPAHGASWTVRAKWVPDGDTLFLVSGEKIRLKGIDCPETAHDGKNAQFYAKEARRYLWRLIRNQDLLVDTRDIGADRFGRIVTYVYLPDGRLLNRVLVENGYAFCFPHAKDAADSLQQDFLRAQQRAMNGLRGMWARILRIPAANKSYIGNSSSRRFHALNCRYARKIRPKNRVVFSTLRQAFYAGYAPCRTCTPWPKD